MNVGLISAGLAAGIAQFDAGHYWHAHEDWESAWRTDAGHDRHFYKGLIQLAAALHHQRRGNVRVALMLLRRARGHLLAHAGPRFPFDHQRLVRLLDQIYTDTVLELPHLPPRLTGLLVR